MPDSNGEQRPRKPLDRHRGHSPATLKLTILGYRIKLIALRGTVLFCTLGVALSILGTIAPSPGKSTDQYEVIFPITNNEARFQAIVIGLLLTAGLIWAVRRLRVHLRSKPDLAVPPDR